MRKSLNVAGIAAIIDSLVFICIVSVITVLILSPQSNEGPGEPWDQSSIVHSVLIHSTIPMVDTNDEGANYTEVQVSELLLQALGSGNRSLVNRLSDHLEQISESLIEPPYHYRWVITGANDEIALGESALPDSCDIKASSLESKRGDIVFTSVLYLWIL
jgi:hypothetical protein